MGITLIFGFIILFVLLLLIGMKYTVHYKYSWYKYYETIRRKIFYNTFIRYFLQSNLKLQIAFSFTYISYDWKGSKHIFQRMTALIGLFVLNLIPFFFYCILKRKKYDLWKPSVKA